LTDRVDPPAEIQFFKRLKPELGKDLVRLCGQDHYVEVCTKGGKVMILMRFSDAMDELVGFAGLQVHRSHWVSLAAIERVEKTGNKLKIKMSDGSEVPVSRSYRSTVKDAGLL
jgi:DNA-binding LytR/AlgR family response regulator